MKYIKKEKEPNKLKKYRETTSDATYKGFVDTDSLLKKSLLQEQGHVCAYCMQRISLKRSSGKPKIEVEHILSQKHYSEKSLDYNNMLAVCNGNLGGEEHCDKSKKEQELKVLSLLKKECEHLITYSTSGEIKSISNNTDVIYDIETILNLNNQDLIDMRKNAVISILNVLKEDYPQTQWKKEHFEKKIHEYSEKNTDSKYLPFYGYIIWYLNFLKSKPKYN
ncbi:MAG: TIGR02646 family protein [Bacteroidales bacterium]|nr:TIGR02646 family protein [Bacteroidales bacterium]